MKLGQFKEYIASFPEGTRFPYGISNPFSWRGSYDEVAFSIMDSPQSRESILQSIQVAYTEIFTGWKGGQFTYGSSTTVNFEEGRRDYTDGNYAANMIAKIERQEVYQTQTERLIKLAFTTK